MSDFGLALRRHRADLLCVLQIVTLPYNLVLQKSAREALGIDLTDQILVIDEAHSQSPRLPVVLHPG